jgi:thiol-disulfide isomerase/thioredoxin
MKKYLLLLALLSQTIIGFSQGHYETLIERPNEKTYKGILIRSDVEKDSSFTWYRENFNAFIPLPTAIQTLKEAKDSIKLVAFMGTWCDDSHFVIPRLYAFADAAGFPDSSITMIGVDRKKKAWGNLSEAFHITNVPTIIVMKNGKELGRVIEYGKSGQFDKEVANIISSAAR